jgi:8-oxo-dGTP diphosphatase
MGADVRQAACAVIARDGRFLLGHRSAARTYYANVWDLFGGHVEAGEDAERALRRELVEELGIVALAPEPLALIPEPDPAQHGPGEFHVFLVTQWRGEPVLKGEEHDAIAWFTLEQASALELSDAGILALLERTARRMPSR